MKRKILTILLAVCCAVSLLGIIGCTNDNTVKPSVTLNKTEVTLNVGDTETLTATVKGTKESVKWTTSNRTVVSVSNGTLTALKFGTSTITAKAGEYQAQCLVTVHQLEIEAEEDLALDLGGESKQLDVSAKYDGSAVTASFTYEIEDDDIAEVTSSGLVTAKDFGNTVLTVSTTYNGITVEKEVRIIVELDISTDTVNPDNREESASSVINLATGEVLEGDYIGEKIVAVKVLDAESQDCTSSYTFTWASEDSSVATVEVDSLDSSKAKIKAENVGSTKVNATFTYKGKQFKISFTVNSEMPVYESKDFTVDLSKQENGQKITVKVPAEISAKDIDEITFKNNALTIDSKNESLNTVDLVDVSFASGAQEITVRIGKTLYKADLLYANKIISNKEEFMEFAEIYKDNIEGEYYALSNNVDLNGEDLTQYTGHVTETVDEAPQTTIRKWLATFDGRGYAVVNAKFTHGLFRHIEPTGIVENLAIINPIKPVNGGGLICNELFGTIRNCFVYGDLTAVGQGAFCMTEYAGCTIENCFAFVENAVGVIGGYAGINGASAVGNNKNNFAISKSRTDGMYSQEEETEGLYTSIDKFVEANNDLSSFKGVWTIIDGVPMFNNVIDLLDWDTLEFVTSSEYLFNGDEILTNKRDAYVYLKEAVDGVSLKDGILEVGDIEGDVEITVVAKIIGKYNLEKNFKIRKSIDKFEISYMIDKTNGFSTDLTEIDNSLTDASVVNNVIINGVDVAFTTTGSVVSIPSTSLTDISVGEANIVIKADTVFYRVSGEVVTAVISTVEDFTNIFNSGLQNKSAGNYYVLNANLDFEGADITSNTGYTGCSTFNGTLDGRGYAIINPTFSHGLFASLGASGVIKNLALINPIKPGNGGGLMSNEGYGTIENCFVYGNTTATNQSAFAASGTPTIKNCLGIIGGLGASAIAVNLGKTSNTIAISNLPFNFDKDNAKGNSYFETLADFIKAEVDTSSFTGYWKFVNGLPVLEHVNASTIWNEVNITTDVEFVSNGDKIVADSKFATFSLKTPVEGVSIDLDGTLTIANTVADDTEITVVATILGLCSDEKTYKTLYFVDKTDVKIMIDKTKGVNIDLTDIDSSLTDLSKVDAVLIGSTNVAFTTETTLNIASSTLNSLTVGNTVIDITYDGLKYRVSGEVVTAVISTVEDFTNIFNSGLQNKSAGNYYVLNANLDFEGADITSNTGYAGCSTFSGTFDGRGYAVINAKYNNGFFAALGTTGVIKNLAIINPIKPANGGGLVCNECYGTVENCFIYGTVTASGHYGIAPNGTPNVTNCVVIVDGVGNGSVVQYGSKTSNTIAISNLPFSVAETNGNKLYANIGAFLNDSVDVSSFKGYWTIKGGLPVLVNSLPVIEKLFKDFAITNVESGIEDCGEVTVNGMNRLVNFSLKQDVTGVSINSNGIITIDSTVANGTEITVVASALETYSAEKTFSVIVFTEKDYTNDNSKNLDISVNSTANSIDVSAIDSEFSGETVKLVLNGTTIQSTQSGNVVTFNGSVANALTRGMNEGSLILVCANKAIKAKVNVFVADLIIKDTADLTAFAVGFQSKFSKSNQLITLGNDIDATGFNIGTVSGSTLQNVYFYGTFDGRGFTIKNITVANGLLGAGSYGTVKNLVMLNTHISNQAGGTIANLILGGKVENVCVLDITFTGNQQGGIANKVNGGEVKNCVITGETGTEMTSNWTWLPGFVGTTYAYNNGTGNTLTNVYGISSSVKLFWATQTGVANNCVKYSTVSDFETDNGDLSEYVSALVGRAITLNLE